MFRWTLTVELMIFVKRNVDPVEIFRQECFHNFYPVNILCILVSWRRGVNETKLKPCRCTHTITYILPYRISDSVPLFWRNHQLNRHRYRRVCMCAPSRKLQTTTIVVWTHLVTVINTEKIRKNFHVRVRRGCVQNAFSKKTYDSEWHECLLSTKEKNIRLTFPRSLSTLL